MMTRLSNQQLEMLAISEDDIANGRIISEGDLDKIDLENLFGTIKSCYIIS